MLLEGPFIKTAPMFGLAMGLYFGSFGLKSSRSTSGLNPKIEWRVTPSILVVFIITFFALCVGAETINLLRYSSMIFLMIVVLPVPGGP